MGRRSGTAKKNYVPDDVRFLTKSQIALELIDQSIQSGIRVKAWTFDEPYGWDAHFLDGLDRRQQAFVGEVPPNFRVWLRKPKILRKNRQKRGVGRYRKCPRVSGQAARGYKVENLDRYSPCFRDQSPQRYRVIDKHSGPEVWEIRWHVCWRKTHDGKFVSAQCTLIVATNVLSGVTKYFLGNRVPGRRGWGVRALLRVAFARPIVEICFREAKEELGWDHFECRGWQCVHRHLYVSILSQLFCARVRHRLCRSEIVTDATRLTVEQVRRAMDRFIDSLASPPRLRQKRYQGVADQINYHQRRNAAASQSHWKTRIRQYKELGMDPLAIKSILLEPP